MQRVLAVDTRPQRFGTSGDTHLKVSLGLGQHRVGTAGDEEWVMYGLGSCIGLILCDPVRRVSAAAHMVLPRPRQRPGRGGAREVRGDGGAVFAGADGGAGRPAQRRTLRASRRRRPHAGAWARWETSGRAECRKRHGKSWPNWASRWWPSASAAPTGARCGGICGPASATVRRVGHPDEVITPREYWYGEVHVDGPRVGR